MTDHDDLLRLVRSSLPPTKSLDPSRDLWPLLLERERPRQRVPWLDLGLGAVAAAAVMTVPNWFWLLLYHL